MTIFFLSSGPILPLVGGRRLREYQMLKELARLAPVRVLCTLGKSEKQGAAGFEHPTELHDFEHPVRFTFHALDRPGIFSFLHAFGPHFARGFSTDLDVVLKGEVRRGDVVWASRLRMAKYFARLKKRGVRTILDEHQIESDLMLDEAFEAFWNWAESIAAMQVARYERRLTREAELVVTASTIDAHRVQKLSPRSKVRVIPFELPTAPYVPPTGIPRANRIAFIADLEYQPNLNAIRFMLSEVLPRLRASLGDALPEFIVASSDPVPKDVDYSVAYYESPEGLGRILAECRVAIFPLRQGRGNRIHLLEAMAAGLPIVCTGKAIDGLTVRPSLDLFLANDADGMTSLLLRLLRDPALSESTGRNARETVSRVYGERDLRAEFREIVGISPG